MQITKKQDTRNKKISNYNIQLIKLFGKLNIGRCILFVSCILVSCLPAGMEGILHLIWILSFDIKIFILVSCLPVHRR
jgi:hypothetical protein